MVSKKKKIGSLNLIKALPHSSVPGGGAAGDDAWLARLTRPGRPGDSDGAATAPRGFVARSWLKHVQHKAAELKASEQPLVSFPDHNMNYTHTHILELKAVIVSTSIVARSSFLPALKMNRESFPSTTEITSHALYT